MSEEIKLPELPELPESGYDVWDDYYDGITLSANGPHDRYEGLKLWNEDQMRAYGLSCYEAGVKTERERCANISPNGLDISAAAMPHEVWEKYRAAIREEPV